MCGSEKNQLGDDYSYLAFFPEQSRAQTKVVIIRFKKKIHSSELTRLFPSIFQKQETLLYLTHCWMLKKERQCMS